ncbi:MAG: hypothetical protein JXR59_08215, partial [Desulfuromonadaceae bacterium]|nr:hypothetical protein [Desulfuromonadaceae bacterium]
LRLGIRGALSDSWCYSIKTVSGNNTATFIDSDNRIRLIETSLTWHGPSFPHVRFGLFRPPAGEEAIGMIPPCHYINPTNMSNLLVQERFFESDGSDPRDENQPVLCSCCRDIGVMVFDEYLWQRWEFSYALMLANGHGLSLNDNNDNPDFYGFIGVERLFNDARGIKRQGWKLFAWWQEGQRTLKVGVDHASRHFRRCRYGVGTTLHWKRWRFESEVVKADGMIPMGTDGSAVPGSVSNNGLLVAGYNLYPEEQALGWYADIGFSLTSKLALNCRYDRIDLSTESDLKRELSSWTLGLQYFLRSNVQVKMTYEFRHGEAPHEANASAGSQILDELTDVYAVQLVCRF